jgi:hypothetical protein
MIASNCCNGAPAESRGFLFSELRLAWCIRLQRAARQQTLFSKEEKVVKQVTASTRGPGQSVIVAGEETAGASSDGSSTTAI